MKLVAWLALLLSASAFAQQPPVRVRLLTLYHLNQVTITPRGEASFEQAGSRRPLSGPMEISEQGNVVSVGGRTSKAVRVDGKVEITGEQFRREPIDVPLEVRTSHGELQIVAAFPVEEYVAAVLQGETAGDMPPNALKALAVAIRSYATKFRERHRDEGFDFCDTTHCQFLRTETSATIRYAVKDTENLLLWDRGSPLAAYYHKDCGGRTEDVAEIWPDQKSPSLISHADPYCTKTVKPWRSELSRGDIARALDAAGLRTPPDWNRIIIRERDPSGRARLLDLSAAAAQHGAKISASTFRFALGRALGWNTLKSDWYDVTASGDHFLFNGRGTGHGVGLCQQGAAEMAREGKTWREILNFYYPGTEIGRSAQAIPWVVYHHRGFDIRAVNGIDGNAVAEIAQQAFTWSTKQTGLKPNTLPMIDVFPTVAMFRDATGEPGWVAASTREGHIRLQPVAAFKAKLPDVLRHEFLHLIIESSAKPGTPLWFREGLVLAIAGERGDPTLKMSQAEIDEIIESRQEESETKRAYAAATSLVRALEQKHGRAQLIRWLRDGLPSDVLAMYAHEVAQ